MVDVAEVEVIYATFHVDVGETPFFVALDYTKKKVSRVSSLIRMHRTAFAQETSKREKKERKTIRYRAEITSKASYDVQKSFITIYSLRRFDSMKIAILKRSTLSIPRG